MSRKLKTLYPCGGCGEPTEVGSKREVQFARCRRCGDRARLYFLVDCDDRDRAKHVRKAQEETSARPAVAEWMKACEEALSAGARCFEAVPLAAKATDERHLIRCGTARAEWARNVLGQLGELCEQALGDAQHGFTVIAGCDEPPAVGPPPMLVLLGREGA